MVPLHDVDRSRKQADHAVTPQAKLWFFSDKLFSRWRQQNDVAITTPDPNTIQDGGGARRDRTDDLMLAKHALSQLSYGPGSRRSDP